MTTQARIVSYLFLSPSSTFIGGRWRLWSGLYLMLFLRLPTSRILSTCSFVHVSRVSDLTLEMCLERLRSAEAHAVFSSLLTFPFCDAPSHNSHTGICRGSSWPIWESVRHNRHTTHFLEASTLLAAVFGIAQRPLLYS